MELGRCSRCRHGAVAVQAYSGRALCADHLVRDVEARAKRAVRLQGGIRRSDRIGVLVADEPHGSALLAFAVRQFGRRRDLSLLALVAPGTVPPDGPDGLEVIDVGDEDPRTAAARRGCSVLLRPATLEDRAGAVLRAVLAGEQAALAAPRGHDHLRSVSPFGQIPGLEVRLYLSVLAGGPCGPPPAPPADPLARFAADELARHARAHPSAPFALARLADTLAELASGDSGRC